MGGVYCFTALHFTSLRELYVNTQLADILAMIRVGINISMRQYGS